MKEFLGYPVKKIKPSINSFLNLSEIFNFKKYLSAMYYCYSNNIPCIISTTNKISIKDTSGIYYIDGKKELFFKWDYLISINNFFYKKYNSTDNFTTDPSKASIYYIFLMKFMYKNKTLYKNQGVKILGDSNSLFGIYDNSTNILDNCTHLLYFSNFLSKFILYKVRDMSDGIYGCMMRGFTVTTGNIQYKNEKNVNLPASFVNIKDNIYSIKKKTIKITKIAQNSIKDKIYNKFYYDFLKKNNSRCFYIFETKFNITKTILSKLYEYIILKYPLLDDEHNNVLVDPYSIDISKGNIILILITETNPNKIIIDINQYFTGYVHELYASIIEFLSKITKSETITVNNGVMIFNNDFCFHVISEIMYFYLIIRHSYAIIKNISVSESNQYIQANYTFSKKEATIFQSYSSGNYSEYLKCLISTTLSTFLNNYYIFIHEGSNIDLIPMYEGIDIDTVKKYLNYSQKANYSKFLLTTYLSKISGFLDKNNFDIPIIFLNISEISFNDKLYISKIYGSTHTKSIPIIINVVYNSGNLLINLSYKKKYSKMKYFFNELIDTILNI